MSNPTDKAICSSYHSRSLNGLCQNCGHPSASHRVSTTQTDKASVAEKDALGSALGTLDYLIEDSELEIPEFVITFLRGVRQNLRTLSPAQGDGVRDALADLVEDLRGRERDGERWNPGIINCLERAERALASHPDRQPGMTDEEIENESRSIGWEAVHHLDEMYPAAFKAVPATAKISLRNHVAGKSRDAIKRASQRQ